MKHYYLHLTTQDLPGSLISWQAIDLAPVRFHERISSSLGPFTNLSSLCISSPTASCLSNPEQPYRGVATNRIVTYFYPFCPKEIGQQNSQIKYGSWLQSMRLQLYNDATTEIVNFLVAFESSSMLVRQMCNGGQYDDFKRGMASLM